METDPLNEVRNIRRMISKECNDDPKKVFEYYLKHQEESKRSGKYRFVYAPLQSVSSAHATEHQNDARELCTTPSFRIKAVRHNPVIVGVRRQTWTETHLMDSNPFLHVRSSKLGVMPGEDDELVNEGMYGKAFAEYLRDALVRNGYQATQVVCEDWGWWVTIAGLQFSCGIGIYGMRMDDSDNLDLCATVLTPRGKKWSWARFRFVDTTAEVDSLHQTIRGICTADDDVTIVAETPDFPF